MHIIPTSRDPITNLALSSRNAYLSTPELEVAPVLYRALLAAKLQLEASSSAAGEGITGEDLISAATAIVLQQQSNMGNAGSDMGMNVGGKVRLELDYIEVFDKDTFEPIRGPIGRGRELVIAGAVWVGQTRLIDNLLLGWDM